MIEEGYKNNLFEIAPLSCFEPVMHVTGKNAPSIDRSPRTPCYDPVTPLEHRPNPEGKEKDKSTSSGVVPSSTWKNG